MVGKGGTFVLDRNKVDICMCGIIGSWPSTSINPDYLRHRGPDGMGIVDVSGITLGHTRLKIIDLSGRAAQPKWSQNGNVVMVFNGEIYNYHKLLPSATSDTQALVEWLSSSGPGFDPSRLDGMYAFAVYYLKEKRLILCRDPAGIKPLYLYLESDGSRLAFSSEIKGFFGIDYFHPLPNVDKDNLNDLFQYGYHFENTFKVRIFDVVVDLPAFPTLLKNTYQLVPGIKICIQKKAIARINRYVFTPGNIRHPVSKLLSAAVKAQSISDVPVGVQLSGGLDSSLVAYYYLLNHPNTLGFYISVDNRELNENDRVEIVVKRLQKVSRSFKLFTLKYSSSDFFRSLDRVVWFSDEPPIRHPNAAAIYHLCQFVRNTTDIKVLLTGEGADEMYGGYTWQDGITFQNYDQTRRIFDLGGRSHFNSYFSDNSGFRSVFHKQLLFDRQTYLLPILNRQDKMSMAHAIETRVPFLSNSFLSNRLPQKPGKTELKNLSAEIFGQQYSNLPKQGFGLPWSWLGNLVYSKKSLKWIPNIPSPRNEFQNWSLFALSKWSDYYLHQGWKNVGL